MASMTTEGKLLAQDDIDSLLDEAGLEGNYESEEPEKKPPAARKKRSIVRFSTKSDYDVQDTIVLLYNKAFLEREDDIKVIWNASGTIPMTTGIDMEIQGTGYVSLGVLHENHLVVKSKG
ncbi:MAG: hypothetical protein JRC68_02075 [Deltaproteobacteria bacterium]|nr:hypothetical protein [Deltaproteobacteria bacterium]